MMHRPLIRAGTLQMVLPAYLIAIVPTILFACGVILTIEILAAYSQGNADSSTIRLLRIPFEAANPMTWLAAAVLTVGGFFVARMTWRGVASAWDRAMMAARERGYHA
jgi:branched-chain amino acid transport system permease protein